jgi:hypothetical protein
MGQLCYEADGDRRYYERAVMLDLRSASIKSNGVSSCSVFFKFRLAAWYSAADRDRAVVGGIRITNFDVRFGKIILVHGDKSHDGKDRSPREKR